VTAAVNSGPVAVGSDLNYTFTVANQGTTMATGVVLSHMLPSNVNFVSANASQGTATQSAGIVTASLGTILGGANATVEVDVIPQVIGSFNLQSRVIADQGLLHPSQGSTTIPIDVSPAPPTNVAATVATGTTPLKVTWSFTNPPGKSATFNIYRSETLGGEGNMPYATGITGNQFTDTSQVPGHAYYYQVTAVIGGLESLHSKEAAGSILTAPTNASASYMVVTDVFGNPRPEAELTWQYPALAASNVTFSVYRSLTSGGEGNSIYGGETGLAGFPDLGIVRGNVYYYEVSAEFQGTVGPRSAEFSFPFTVLTAPVISPAPGGMPVNFKNIHVQILKSRTTELVLSVSGALDAADAQDLAAYHLVTLGKLNKKTHQHATKAVKLTSAVYNASQNTVTLAIKGKLPNQPLELSVNTSAVRDASGQPIAGSSGQAGGTFQTTFGKKGITLPSVSAARFSLLSGRA
jgi:uncharacterized repeat protein (TIGR01451 family)